MLMRSLSRQINTLIKYFDDNRLFFTEHIDSVNCSSEVINKLLHSRKSVVALKMKMPAAQCFKM